MYLDVNSKAYKSFQDFEKYARFLSQKFDINIQLEAAKAETDGNVIYLPNVVCMTDAELELMYGILLHEIGHIRYSIFTENAFKSLKTEWMGFLANAIEDARIENCLLKDFAGAKDIFEKMYTEQILDKNLMSKIFSNFDTSKKSKDLFYSYCMAIHSLLCRFETAPFKDIMTAKNFKAVDTMFKKYDLYNRLSSLHLKNWDDVLKLTQFMYDVFTETYKDLSVPLNIDKKVDEKNDGLKAIEKLKEEALSIENKIKDIESTIKEKEENIANFHNDNREEISKLENEILNYKNDLYTFVEELSSRKKQRDIVKELTKLTKNKEDTYKSVELLEQKIKDQQFIVDNLSEHLKKKLDKWEKLLENKKEQIKNNQTKIESGKFATEKLEKLKGDLKKFENHQKEYEQKLSDENIKDLSNEELENLNSLLKKLEKQNKDIINLDNDIADKLKEKSNISLDSNFSSLNDDELNNNISHLNEKISSSNKELEKLLNEIEKIKQDIEKFKNQKDKMQNEMVLKTYNKLKEINQGLDGFEVQLVEPQNYGDVWPEAAKVQSKFDEEASNQTQKPVANGQFVGLTGSNIRDIITHIDHKKEQVKDINILDMFKDKINPSRLDSFQENSMYPKNSMDKTSKGLKGSYRPHLPLTTVFDTITNKNMGVAPVKLLQNNRLFIEQLKAVFVKKFKYSKKPYWVGAQEDGKLDVRSIWKLPTNMGNDFFEINRNKFQNQVTASILIDVSGSQEKKETNFGENLKVLALALSESLDKVHIKHEILGYHAPVCSQMRNSNASNIYTRRSNNLDTIVYKNFKQKDKGGISNIETHLTDNSDGESFKVAVKRLKKEKAKSHMIFVISDCKPYLCDTDIEVLDNNLHHNIKEAKQNKVKVFGLGFFPDLQHFYGQNYCHIKSYNDIIKFFENQKNMSNVIV